MAVDVTSPGPLAFIREQLFLMTWDQERETNTLAKVEEFSIGTDSWSIGIPEDVRPLRERPGVPVATWGKGFGYTVRGLVIGDTFCYYLTPEQEEARRQREREERDREKTEEMERLRPAMEAKSAWLPDLFRQRLDRFRRNNPDFDRDFLAYEMFCIEEAVRVVSHFTHRYPAYPGPAFLYWRRLTRDDKGEWCSEGEDAAALEYKASDQHSGNTHGVAMTLARCWLECPDRIPQMHGAMSGLTGCFEYGCHTKDDFPDDERSRSGRKATR